MTLIIILHLLLFIVVLFSVFMFNRSTLACSWTKIHLIFIFIPPSKPTSTPRPAWDEIKPAAQNQFLSLGLSIHQLELPDCELCRFPPPGWHCLTPRRFPEVVYTLVTSYYAKNLNIHTCWNMFWGSILTEWKIWAMLCNIDGEFSKCRISLL